VNIFFHTVYDQTDYLILTRVKVEAWYTSFKLINFSPLFKLFFLFSEPYLFLNRLQKLSIEGFTE
jgi:hypothetical protein